MSVTTCPNCNTAVPPGAVFCDNCGYDLRTVNAQPEAPVQATYQVSPPEGDLNCQSCGYANIAGSAFCENCGSQLAMPSSAPPTPPPASTPPPVSPQPVQPSVTPPPVEPTPEPPPPPPPSFISGHFIIPEGNKTLQIPQGKQTIIIGREDPVSGIFPDIDLDQHGGQDAGVGRRHAQLLLQSGQLLIEDLDSVNGTIVNKQKIAPRKPKPINDGDEIRLGKLVLIFHGG